MNDYYILLCFYITFMVLFVIMINYLSANIMFIEGKMRGAFRNRKTNPQSVPSSAIYDGHAGMAEVIIEDMYDNAEETRRIAEDMVRESEDRYFRLQMSLYRFSSELSRIVKVEDLNQRIVQEVCRVIETDQVSFLEVDQSGRVAVIHGCDDVPPQIIQYIRELQTELLPPCQLIDTLEGHFIKTGEIYGKCCLLCIGESAPTLRIQAVRIWLETISRYVNVQYDNFRVIEDLKHEMENTASQQSEPVWLLRLMFQWSEKERKYLAQDLHDAALQEQIIWYRKVDQLLADVDMPKRLYRELEAISQGLLDVIYQIRITCNELRPPLLKDLGLEQSLRALFEFTQLRSDYAIRFDCDGLSHDLHDDLLIGLYRIVQEMLANATKHAKATQVIIRLFSSSDAVYLWYEDNGIGMKMEQKKTFGSMGIYGIKERVRSMQGEVAFTSSQDEGVSISISIPAA